MRLELHLESRVSQSFRVQSLASRMDMMPGETTAFDARVEIPDEAEQWSIGLIVGPSGSGKSQVLRKAYSQWADASAYEWAGDSFLDDFPEATTENISRALAAAGLSSVPAWLVPYRFLSNGQQQRASVARALVSDSESFVYDEFTSLLDRVVARTTCMAASKAIRRLGKRCVVATCHYDIAEWLEADWVLDMATGSLARGRLQRPKFEIGIHPASRTLWPMFAPHHYMSPRLATFARCFVATINVGGDHAICGWMSFIPVTGYKKRWRGHRAVVLPEYQGAGIGSRFTDECFAIMADEDPERKLSGVLSSLSLNIAHAKSKHWRLTRSASKTSLDSGARRGAKRASERLTTSWEWVR